MFWPEPVESPVSTPYPHRNFRFVGAHHEDDSNIARCSSNASSRETVNDGSNSVMSSLLEGLPEVPRLRRRQGQSNLRLRSTPNQHVSPQSPDGPNTGEPRRTTSVGTPERLIQAETRQLSHENHLNHDLRPQPSVPDAVQFQMFSPRPYTPPTLGRSLGSPGPTIHEETPTSASSDSRTTSGPRRLALIDRPQNPLTRDFAVADAILTDPFMQAAQAGPSTAPNATGGRRLWSEHDSSSSDSRVYLENGRYRLHDGSIHEIPQGSRGH